MIGGKAAAASVTWAKKKQTVTEATACFLIC